MDEAKEELSALYVLDLLEPDEARKFEAELLGDLELRWFVDSLRETLGSLALTAPQKLPPPVLKQAILEQLRDEDPSLKPAGISKFPLLPWGVAAALALVCGVLGFDHMRMKREIVDLRNANELSEMKIATLGSLSESSPKGAGVVIWDEGAQKGILRVENMQPLQDRDYELWVVDPKYPQPVKGGVFSVDGKGTARVAFQPDQPVSVAMKFAVSEEKKGGVPKAEGPIVMLGQ